MPTADATLEFLDRLGDPTKWVIRRGIPVFEPHTRKDKDGRPVEVTPATLEWIAQAMRDLQREKGVVAAIGPGHRNPQPGFPETRQPPVYGYSLNPRVGTYGPDRKPAVLIDEYLKPEHAADAGEYPFRSVEYYPTLYQFRWVALLKREPFLDMGMVAYHGPGGATVFHYATEPIMPEPDKKEPAAKPAAKPAAGAAPEPKPGPADEDLSPEEEKTAERYMRHYQRKHPFVSYAMKCYEGSMASAATATNAALPGTGAPAKKPEEDMTSLQSNAEFVAYQRAVNDRLALLETENKALRQDRERQACLSLLAKQCVHYQYDPDTEAAILLSLDAAGRQGRLDYLKRTLREKPHDERLLDTDPGVGVEGRSGEPAFTSEDMHAALAYQDEKNCTWEQAVRAVERGDHKRKAG